MEVSEVRELQEELEDKIETWIEVFEEKTGTIISQIDIERIDTRSKNDAGRYKNFINQVKTTIEL